MQPIVVPATGCVIGQVEGRGEPECQPLTARGGRSASAAHSAQARPTAIR